ncbi:MAG TPA: hypothetical protein VFR47_17540 [Anaerolineales bacterium]|nr:hypothetical protein [Anaerolineales bacterium]
MINPIVFPSPNKKHTATLSLIGEIQPGLGYYTLSIDKFPLLFANRVFGKVCMWSPDSRFLAIQEWKDADESNVHKSYLLLIVDVLTKRECLIASIESMQGNILPQGFIGDSLMYTVIYYGQFGMTKNFESQFQYLNGWQSIK